MITTEEMLSLAERLAGETQEVCQRASVGRAYYSVHHALLPLAQELPEVKAPISPGRIGHREVVARLELWQHPNAAVAELKHAAQVVSRTLRGMIAAREQADYHVQESFSPHMAGLQIRRAREVSAFLGRVLRAKESAA